MNSSVFVTNGFVGKKESINCLGKRVCEGNNIRTECNDFKLKSHRNTLFV